MKTRQNLLSHALLSMSHFRICVRKRPIVPYEMEYSSYDCVNTDNNILTLHDGRLARNGRRLSMNHRGYLLDRVWNEKSTNADVCHDEIGQLVDWAKQGHSSTLICFGQVCWSIVDPSQSIFYLMVDDGLIFTPKILWSLTLVDWNRENLHPHSCTGLYWGEIDRLCTRNNILRDLRQKMP